MSQFDYEIAKVINFLESAFGSKLGEEQFKVYVKSLGSTNMIKLQAAAEKIVRENVYFPKLSEILKAVQVIPDRALSPGLMLDHQRKVKLLKDRFYRTREIDRSGFDALYRELREAGYWDKAEYVVSLGKRFEEQLKVESQELTGLKAEV
jgi:hypothetical protein